MDNLYRDFILEHYRRPHNKGVLPEPDLSFGDSNPQCGDEMSMTLKLDDRRERIAEVAFEGRGLQTAAKLGILVASVVASLAGVVVLRACGRAAGARPR